MEKKGNERKPSRNPDRLEKESRHLAKRNKRAAGLSRRPSTLRALLYQIPYPLEIMSG
jgi:demethoxyubiquinone hydroxylase (CLK1/Coq7/Cat5 family)